MTQSDHYEILIIGSRRGGESIWHGTWPAPATGPQWSNAGLIGGSCPNTNLPADQERDLER